MATGVTQVLANGSSIANSANAGGAGHVGAHAVGLAALLTLALASCGLGTPLPAFGAPATQTALRPAHARL